MKADKYDLSGIKIISINMIKIIFLGLIGVLILFATCKKEEDTNYKAPEYIEHTDVNENVSIIDSTKMYLISDRTEISKGIFKFESKENSLVKYLEGDIIIVYQNGGYLRKVISCNIVGSIVTVETAQANLYEAFNDININESIILGGSNNSLKSSNLIEEDRLIDIPINIVGNIADIVRFSITDGRLSFNPNFRFEYEGFKKMGLYSDNTSFSLYCTVKASATSTVGVDTLKYEQILPYKFKREILIPVPGGYLPGEVVIDFKFVARVVSTASFDFNMYYNYNYLADIGLAYRDGELFSIYNKSEDNNDFTNIQWSLTQDLGLKVYLVAIPRLYICNFAGPYLEAGIVARVGGAKSSTNDWNFAIGAGGRLELGVKSTEFYFLGEKKEWKIGIPVEKIFDLYSIPDSLQLIEGQNQKINLNEKLATPIKLRVVDSKGEPVENAQVYLNTIKGEAVLDSTLVKTNTEGYVITNLKCTNNIVVLASVRKADGTGIKGSPLEIEITANEPSSVSIYSGNNQTAQPGQALPSPISVIVKNAEGLPYQGATVSFSTANGGVLSAENVVTNENGIASVSWQLGTTDGLQTVYAKVYKSDGVMQVAGSPSVIIAYGINEGNYSIYNQMVNIPAGTFTMGSHTTEIGHRTNERQYQVTLSAFRMSKYEITNAQFAAFLNAKSIGSDGKYTAGAYPTKALIYSNIHLGLIYTDGQWVPVAGYENHPVIRVTWYGATEFATYVGGTLPTEAQWEYACRAGTTTPFNTGACLSNEQANYNWASPYSTCTNTVTTYPGTTQAVGTYAANAYGLHDMHGNVWEWCSDWHGTYPTTAQTNPTGATTGSARVLRGGCWLLIAQYCRSAFRSYSGPNHSSETVGFRVVLVP